MINSIFEGTEKWWHGIKNGKEKAYLPLFSTNFIIFEEYFIFKENGKISKC